MNCGASLIPDSGSRPHSLKIEEAQERVVQHRAFFFHRFTDEAKAMSRLDSLKEARRGTGATCPCGKPARSTVRGQTLCYECFDEDMGYILDPVRYVDQRMRERVREIERRHVRRAQHYSGSP